MTRKKMVRGTLLLVLALGMLLCGAACRPTPSPSYNEAVSSVWGIDLEYDTLIRYDFNAQGKPLGAEYVDWYTLMPRDYLGTELDRTYEYDHAGKLIGHTVEGVSLALEFDDRGHPVSGLGYGGAGVRYSVVYECDTDGSILSEVCTCGARRETYTYDAKGRLIKRSHEQFGSLQRQWSMVTEEEIGYTDTEVKLGTYTLKLNEQGNPSELWDGEETLFTWTWDEKGRCVGSQGLTPESDFTAALETVLEYDGQGRLVRAENDRTEVQYEYDGAGRVVKASRCQYTSEGSYGKTLLTCEYVNGEITTSKTQYFRVDDAGNETLERMIVNEYPPLTEHARLTTHYQLDGQGNAVIVQVDFFDADNVGRLVHSSQTSYLDGEPSHEKYSSQTYTQDDAVATLTDGEAYYGKDADGKSVKITDFATTHHYNADAVEYRETGTGVMLREDGVWSRTTSESDLDGQGRTLRYATKSYENDVLVRETLTEYDFALGNEIEQTYSMTEYENGEVVRTIYRRSFENGGDEILTKEYVGGVVRTETLGDYEDGEWRTDEYLMFTRPIGETVKHYDEHGKLTATELREYEYHDNGYRLLMRVSQKDAEGNSVRSYTEQYDEAGKLIGTAENE